MPVKHFTNKDRNKVRRYMIDYYSADDEYNKDRFPKLKTKKERAVAYMEADGKSATSNYDNRYGRNKYREGERLVDGGNFGFYYNDAYELVKKVYGKKKADEYADRDDDTIWKIYRGLIAKEYTGMVNDLHSGKDVMLKTTSKTKKSPAKKKTSRWR